MRSKQRIALLIVLLGVPWLFFGKHGTLPLEVDQPNPTKQTRGEEPSRPLPFYSSSQYKASWNRALSPMPDQMQLSEKSPQAINTNKQESLISKIQVVGRNPSSNPYKRVQRAYHKLSQSHSNSDNAPTPIYELNNNPKALHEFRRTTRINYLKEVLMLQSNESGISSPSKSNPYEKLQKEGGIFSQIPHDAPVADSDEQLIFAHRARGRATYLQNVIAINGMRNE